MKILLSAYACEPRKGSEPGVGWNAARILAERHEVWVLTRANNRAAIERELADHPARNLHFVYYDVPPWIRWWKRRSRGLQLYYYLWQVGAYFVMRRLHRRAGFDLTHHVTFGKYWAPSLLALLPVPFVWGPVGGGESAPRAFRRVFGLRGRTFESLRAFGRWCGEHDPLVRLTVRRSALALAKANETAARLRSLGAREVRLFPEGRLLMAEIAQLIPQRVVGEDAVKFVSMGRLVHFKGFQLGLRAFARAGLEGAEYWIIGEGPERKRLETEARGLGIADRVRFWGWVPQKEALRMLGEGHVLVHPTLHDSGGGATLEAMAIGRPVICFDLGGSAVLVTDETGVKVPARDPAQAVRDLAEAMQRLAHDRRLLRRMAEAGRQRSAGAYRWEDAGVLLEAIYREAMQGGTAGARDSSEGDVTPGTTPPAPVARLP